MRETALMDFLGGLRDGGTAGEWAPTSEKVIANGQLTEKAETARTPGASEREPSPMLGVTASRFDPPAAPAPEDTPLRRPPGFGPPRRGGGATADHPGRPALSPDDLEALEQLTVSEEGPLKPAPELDTRPAPRRQTPPAVTTADADVLPTWPPPGATPAHVPDSVPASGVPASWGDRAAHLIARLKQIQKGS